MNRKILILLVLLTMGVVLDYSNTAQNASATVAGGVHDLSFWGASNFKYASDEPCVFCHTPHASNVNSVYSTNPNTISGTGSGNTNPAGKLLWNRALPDRAWNVYASSTLNHNTSGGPGTLSLMCLSCHDGVGAMNVLLNYSDIGGQPGAIGFMQNQFGDFALNDPNIGPLNIGGAGCTGDDCASGGGDLQNDHPIGFVYNDTLDSGLVALGSLNATLQRRMAVTSNRMECSTCHDPHITNAGGNNFLVMSNTGSALCLSCHNK